MVGEIENMVDKMETRRYRIILTIETVCYPNDKDSTIRKGIMRQFREEDFPYIVGDEEADFQVRSGSIKRI